MDKKKTATAFAVIVLALGAGWALGFFDTTDPKVSELQQLRNEAFDRRDDMSDDDRRAQFEAIRQRVDELSEEQRRAFHKGGRERFQQMMVERMNEFFAMTPEDQKARLDEIIDRIEERRANRDQSGGGRPGGGRGNMSAAQRDQRSKERLDRSTPEMRAKMDRFRDMMNDRRQQRGLEPLEGGRGMFGGRGGRSR